MLKSNPKKKKKYAVAPTAPGQCLLVEKVSLRETWAPNGLCGFGAECLPNLQAVRTENSELSTNDLFLFGSVCVGEEVED